MRLGYNSNGFAHHLLDDALRIFAELGYESVALTLDHHSLNPYDAAFPAQVTAIASLLCELRLHCVIETGARFLLDPRRKHQPTLLSPTMAERERRFDFLCRAVELARVLSADAVSFWSGTPTDAQTSQHFDRLVDGCKRLADYAADRGVRLAFEPEPGMFIDTMDRFTHLHQQVDRPNFGLTLDIGHVHCLGEEPIADQIERWQPWLWNIHIEDMRHGVHDHLMFGEGDIDFIPVFQALRHINYAGGVHVELSRHSHDAVETARRALAYLRAIANSP